MIEHFKSLRCGQISNSFFCAVFLRDLSVCAIFYTFSNYAIKMKRKKLGKFCQSCPNLGQRIPHSILGQMDSISCWLRWYNGYPTVAVGIDAKMRKCDPKQSPIRVVLRPSNVNYATKPLQKENPKTFSNFVSIYALAGWLCQVLCLSHLILNVIRTHALGKCRSNVTSVPPTMHLNVLQGATGMVWFHHLLPICILTNSVCKYRYQIYNYLAAPVGKVIFVPHLVLDLIRSTALGKCRSNVTERHKRVGVGYPLRGLRSGKQSHILARKFWAMKIRMNFTKDKKYPCWNIPANVCDM